VERTRFVDAESPRIRCVPVARAIKHFARTLLAGFNPIRYLCTACVAVISESAWEAVRWSRAIIPGPPPVLVATARIVVRIRPLLRPQKKMCLRRMDSRNMREKPKRR